MDAQKLNGDPTGGPNSNVWTRD